MEKFSDKEFASLIEGVCPFEKEPIIAVAVSGGADSLALTLLLDNWARSQKGRVIALTVDHRFRKSSKKEAIKVGKWLEKYDIEHHVLVNEKPKPKSNLQDEARALRYEMMTSWCKENDILHLAVAHHLDDQAETFLIRLGRGSGVDGLSSMAKVSVKNEVTIIRPLLQVPTLALKKYLKDKKQKWIEDPTNKKDDYTRNKIRKLLLKMSDKELMTGRLAETAKNMARARAALEQQTAREMVKCLELNDAGFCSLNVENFKEITEEIALRILSSTLSSIGGNAYRPRFEKLFALYSAILEKNNFKGRTLWGCKIFASKDKKQIIICREESKLAKDRLISKNKEIHWDERFVLSLTNGAQPTDYKGKFLVGALGQKGWLNIKKSLKKGSKIDYPKEVLYSLPCLKQISSVGIEKIISVPHINFNATGSSKTVLKYRLCLAKPLAGLPFGCYA